MQLIHKVDLNSLLDEKIRLTHNDINVHIFEIKAPDFIDELSTLNITMNIVDLWGNYVRINNEGLEGRNIRFRLSEFFKTIGTRTCEVVFSKEGKIYHAQKFKYHVEKNLDDDCSVEETEQYPIILELLEKVKKQLEETGALNTEVQELIDDIEDKLAKGEFDGRSVDFKIDEYKVGFKYSDEEEYQWVDLETKIPADMMKEIEKIKHKADTSYVDGQVIILREELATKENLANTEQTLQDNIDLKVDKTIYEDNNIKLNQKIDLKADKTEIPDKLSQLENDAEFITQEDVIEYDDTKLKVEINTLKETKANKSEVPTRNSQLINDSKFITLQEAPKFDDSDIKNSISQLEQNKANLVHTHVSSEIKHNTTTLDKELNDINANIKLKANKSEIPAKLSQLENDKGFITEADIDLTEVNSKIDSLEKNKADKIHEHSSDDIKVQDETLTETISKININLDKKADSKDLKTRLSEFENDTKFTTIEEVSNSDTIKNINKSLNSKINLTEKGKADGVVPLNKDSKIALEYLPDPSKQQTHVIEAVEDMQQLESLLAGDKAFVVSSGDSYIWSGTEWKVLSKAEWENINLDWANIINNPLTSDDLVNIPKISAKADKNDIPSKISQLEDDKNITKDIQILKGTKVDKVEGKQLSTNDYTTAEKDKLSKLNNYNDTDIKAEIAKKVDKIEGKQLSTNDYTTVEINKLAKLENYDDSGIKADIAKKVDILTVNTNLSTFLAISAFIPLSS